MSTGDNFVCITVSVLVAWIGYKLIGAIVPITIIISYIIGGIMDAWEKDKKMGG
jgi:hypothetical protein